MGLLIVIILVALFGLSWIIAGYRSQKKEIEKDRVINETNYNISLLDREEIDNMSPQEARNLIQNLQDNQMLTSLPQRDFFALQEKIKELKES